MTKKKISILGSNSHIAKGLIYNFLKTENISLYLYTRNPQKTKLFIEKLKKAPNTEIFIKEGYADDIVSNSDLLINCVGVGTAKNMEGEYSRWFTVIEKFDNLCLEYLKQNPNTLYISFSSGSIYGEFSNPVGENTVNNLQVNNIQCKDYYPIARINSEAKHRSFEKFKIVDLRIFSYFSRFADLNEDYFINELISSVINQNTFITNETNIVRDYIHPDDLFKLIMKCSDVGKINAAFDVISKAPVEKFEIINYFASNYNLKYEVKNSLDIQSGTGKKNVYYSKFDKAKEILGFEAENTSLEAIVKEAKYIIEQGIRI